MTLFQQPARSRAPASTSTAASRPEASRHWHILRSEGSSRIADGLGAHAANVHFEDHLENGRMCFDYTMRPGVVTKSNALALMRAVGLKV